MKNRDLSVLIPIGLMLLVILTTWLGIAGPIFHDTSADAIGRGWYQFIKDWQTTGAAIMAVVAAVIAWKNVSRQLRLNALTREEDRLERTLPALKDARDLLSLALLRSTSASGPTSNNSELRQAFPSVSSTAIRDRLPGADPSLQREIFESLNAFMHRSQALSDAWTQTQRERNQQGRFELERAAYRTAQKGLEAHVQNLRDRQAISEARLARIRIQIERIIG